MTSPSKMRKRGYDAYVYGTSRDYRPNGLSDYDYESYLEGWDAAEKNEWNSLEKSEHSKEIEIKLGMLEDAGFTRAQSDALVKLVNGDL